MVIFTTPDEWSRLRSALYPASTPIGFVPTMGALHPGHQSLFSRAKSENEVCVGSIFVNPTQFNQPDDLVNYPRTLQSDIEAAEAAGCDYLFVPSVKTMYGNHAVAEPISYGLLTDAFEGAMRPGHFDGVIAIVRKLLTAIKPNVLYLGEKDFQQLAVLREMVKREAIPVDVRGCTLVRETDGLAMSSRNIRLSASAREVALNGIRILREMNESASRLAPDELIEWGTTRFATHPSINLEYLAIIDERNFMPIERFNDANARILAAFWVDGVRLIDNLRIQN
ncbi:MAG: pantoate--beta-alanine ligase [Flavobacteriales bacterium]